MAPYGHLIVHLFDLFESISSRDAAGFQKRRSKLILRLNHKKNGSKKMAPAAGFEPATKWLTATYSTAELCRNI